MFKISPLKIILTIGLFFFGFATLHTSSMAQEAKTYDPNLAITYPHWTAILKDTVLETGRSTRTRPPSLKASAGTRMNRGNKKITRLEGNRVLFNKFGKKNKKYLNSVIASLAGLPLEMALDNFHPNEQLAYWLNLRNMMVFELVVQKYPTKQMNRHMAKFSKKKSITVGDRKLSVKDIETLVIKQFKNPNVIYGFFTGAIGGPNLRDKPFTATTVWADLESNGKDFVNSFRGVQFKNNTAKISTHYEYNKLAFANFEEDVLSHMKKLAEPDVLEELNNAQIVKAEVEDWYIADLYGGTIGMGSAATLSPAALLGAFRGTDPDPDVQTMVTLTDGFGTIGEVVITKAEDLHGLPAHVITFLQQVSIRNRDRRLRTGRVTIDEIEKANFGTKKKQ